MAQTAASIFRDEGVRGLWRGNVPAEILWVSYAAVQFSVYAAARSLLLELGAAAPGERASLAERVAPVVAGGVAGVAATVATYPFDVVRTHIASQGVPKMCVAAAAAASQ